MAAGAQDDEQRDGSGGGHDPEHVRRFDGRKVRGRISLACRGAAGQDERLAGEAVLVHQRAVDSDAVAGDTLIMRSRIPTLRPL